ncbi:hypothetical protein AB836_01025 [Rickettsiales bacterium (ex Bugula neritina AB1)]|nr:hypothetical protein AB836_01025 [Rickettsiales bacterium (ex Bugula neritina AB1)]
MKRTYEENIFTKIINKKIPSSIIFENNYLIAFEDINPEAKHHILIIPKGLYIDYKDFYENASKEEHKEFYHGIYEIIKKKNLTNFKLITNNGKDVGQIIFHFHVHILSNDN